MTLEAMTTGKITDQLLHELFESLYEFELERECDVLVRNVHSDAYGRPNNKLVLHFSINNKSVWDRINKLTC